MKGYPSAILIKKGVWYDLEWHRDLGYHRGEKVLGEACPVEKKIALLSGLGRKQTFIILAHEILHCIEFEYNIKIPHNLIYKIQEGLGFVIQRNFQWLEWHEDRRRTTTRKQRTSKRARKIRSRALKNPNLYDQLPAKATCQKGSCGNGKALWFPAVKRKVALFVNRVVKLFKGFGI